MCVSMNSNFKRNGWSLNQNIMDIQKGDGHIMLAVPVCLMAKIHFLSEKSQGSDYEDLILLRGMFMAKVDD